MQGTIFNITRFCTDDGPGIRTTVFLKGCPLHCMWCHNPESQKLNIEKFTNGEVIGKVIDANEVFQEVIRDRIYYEMSGGGVTVSGGEPLMQADFTTEIFEKCKSVGIHTAIETSGYAPKRDLKKVLRVCDLVLFDIKETDESKHLLYTGVSSEPIIDNLKLVNEMEIPFIIRAPIIPRLNDRTEHLMKIGAYAKQFSCCLGVELMPYHKLGAYKYEQLGCIYACSQIEEPTEQEIEKWKKL